MRVGTHLARLENGLFIGVRFKPVGKVEPARTVQTIEPVIGHTPAPARLAIATYPQLSPKNVFAKDIIPKKMGRTVSRKTHLSTAIGLGSLLDAIAAGKDRDQSAAMIAHLLLNSMRAILALLVTVLALGSNNQAQATALEPLPFTLKEVGPGIYAAIDGPAHQAGSNSGFIIGDDGVLVVDGFFNLQAARALVTEIRRLTAKPIRYIVNTHYHLDHTGGDQAFRDAGAIIIAHRNVRSWLRSNNLNLFGDRVIPEIRAEIAALPLPDLVTDKDLTVWLGSRKVVINTRLGHTGGDLTIYVPDANVLFTGDLLWRKIPPNLIDGSVAEWSATDADFAAMADSRHILYVPGHGDVASLQDVQDFREYLLHLRQWVSEGRKAGLRDDALLKAVAPKLKAAFPDWQISSRAASAEIRSMDEELAGTKRRPVAQSE